MCFSRPLSNSLRRSLSSDENSFNSMESVSQGVTDDRGQSSKRLRLDCEHMLVQPRRQTFSNWSGPKSMPDQMMNAGFYSCNDADRVLCLYCDLICQNWNCDIDDPSEVHRSLSPDCVFVKQNLMNPKNEENRRPVHPNYLKMEQREESFHRHRYVLGDAVVNQLVTVGFFANVDQQKETRLVCFFCGHSLAKESANHALIHHLRQVPHCHFAKHLCGEELCFNIRQTFRQAEQRPTAPLAEHHDQNHETLDELVNAHFDLPMSRDALRKYSPEVVKFSWRKTLQRGGDGFATASALHLACWIRQKEIDLQNQGHYRICIPNEEKKRSIKKTFSSSSELLAFFDGELVEYQSDQIISHSGFCEDQMISIDRERSYKNYLLEKPSKAQMFQAGWKISDGGQDAFCPHCHVHYSSWTTNDVPLDIHRWLSQLCPFVLSSSPLLVNQIPKRTAREQYSPEVLNQAANNPARSVFKLDNVINGAIHNRQQSFNRFPGGAPSNVDQLADQGFYFNPLCQSVICFSCRVLKSILNTSGNGDGLFPIPTHYRQCSYNNQRIDVDRYRAMRNGINACEWCQTGEPQYLAFPCRHLVLCDVCCNYKSVCPRCQENTESYVRIFH